jgi:hypothetical protein
MRFTEGGELKNFTVAISSHAAKDSIILCPIMTLFQVYFTIFAFE